MHASQVLDPEQTRLLQQLCRTGADLERQRATADHTRVNWCVRHDPSLKQLMSVVIDQLHVELHHCVTHQHMCELINMVCYPHAAAQPFHADNYTTHQHMRWYTVGVCLTDLDDQTGTFDYMPGTHHVFDQMSATDLQHAHHMINHTPDGARRVSQQHGVDVTIKQLHARAGDVYCYDARMLHRGTRNVSRDRYRSVLYFTFGPAWDAWYEHGMQHFPELTQRISTGRMSGQNMVHETWMDRTYRQFVT